MFKTNQSQAKTPTKQRTMQEINDEYFRLSAELGELEFNYQTTQKRQSAIIERIEALAAESNAVQETFRKANEAAAAAAKANVERIQVEETKLNPVGGTEPQAPGKDADASLN